MSHATAGSPQLKILIPTWNERANLELLLPELSEVTKELGVAADVIIVDAGSSDGTKDAASRLGARVVPQRERGYGGALIAGFAASTSPYRILNRTFGWLLALPFRDLSSGFRLYRRDVLLALHPVARDFDILEELLIELYARGCVIREIAFHYKPRGAGHSHARLLKSGWSHLKTLSRMWVWRFQQRD